MQQLSDRALKERIIGAAVLVTFVVLVVPVFLDGPSQGTETVTESLTLPGQNAEEMRQQTIVLERDRSEPLPTKSSESAPPEMPAAAEKTEATRPQPVAEEPPAKAEPAPVPVAAAADTTAAVQSSTGMFAVQLGSFSSQENAERLAAQLRAEGYAAFLSRLNTDGNELHRVRVGPQKDRASAESVAAKLSDAGHRGQVVPHP